MPSPGSGSLGSPSRPPQMPHTMLGNGDRPIESGGRPLIDSRASSRRAIRRGRQHCHRLQGRWIGTTVPSCAAWVSVRPAHPRNRQDHADLTRAWRLTWCTRKNRHDCASGESCQAPQPPSLSRFAPGGRHCASRRAARCCGARLGAAWRGGNVSRCARPHGRRRAGRMVPQVAHPRCPHTMVGRPAWRVR